MAFRAIAQKRIALKHAPPERGDSHKTQKRYIYVARSHRESIPSSLEFAAEGSHPFAVTSQ